MSRSNPSDAARNPSARWFQFAGDEEGGYVRYYDKEKKENIALGDAQSGSNFQFVLLDELATVSGWHDPSQSGIFSNEVRDTRQDTLVVKAFSGGELASGLYSNIKDRIVAVGGHFAASCYIAFKDGDDLRIGNILFKSAAFGAWLEFKKKCPVKRDAKGASVKAYYVDAVKIKGFEQKKKGKITFRIPLFSLVTLSEETNRKALELDVQLQAYLSDYLKRPRVEAAAVSGKTTSPASEPQQPQEPVYDTSPDSPPFSDEKRFAEDEIPF